MTAYSPLAGSDEDRAAARARNAARQHEEATSSGAEDLRDQAVLWLLSGLTPEEKRAMLTQVERERTFWRTELDALKRADALFRMQAQRFFGER